MGNKFLDTVKTGCAYFSVIVLLFYSLNYFINKSNIGNLDIKYIWFFFIFSILLAFSNRILYVNAMHMLLRIGIHFVVSFILYLLVVVICCGFTQSSFQTIVAIIAFIIIYAIAITIYAIRTNKKIQKKNEAKGYSAQFK